MLCGAAALASCNLDTIPTDKYTVETFWETEEGTEAAMTGCYNILTNSALFGDSAPLLEETCTPNAYNYNNAGGYNVIAQGTHTANSSGIIANRWKKCYEGIGRCNTHLNRLPAAVVADDRRVQMEGEAKFLRALYYYMLVTYYNGVPLILEEPVYAHGSLPRASREEVVRAILDDLNDIIDRELLDWQWTKAADQGRATRGAAMALKARLLLFEASKLVNPSNDAAKWQAAADAAKAVIEKEAQAGYDLFGDYRKLFLPANEHSCECVFNIEFSKTKNTAVNSFNVYSVQYRNNAPLLDLVMDYRTTTDGAATMGKYDNLDPRFAATNFYPGSTFLGKANCRPGRCAVHGLRTPETHDLRRAEARFGRQQRRDQLHVHPLRRRAADVRRGAERGRRHALRCRLRRREPRARPRRHAHLCLRFEEPVRNARDHPPRAPRRIRRRGALL